MPGPLPTKNPRRRNEPTMSTTPLPAKGRPGPAPRAPIWRTFGVAGRAWWDWAWQTPQAAAWPSGCEDFVARRAALEDDLLSLEQVPMLNLPEVLGIPASEATATVERIMRRLHAIVGGRVGLMKEMRELDNRLGLNPKAMAELRWSIAPDEVAQQREARATRPRAVAVDANAVAGA